MGLYGARTLSILCGVNLVPFSANIHTLFSLFSLFLCSLSLSKPAAEVDWDGRAGAKLTTANSISTGDSLVMILLFTKLSGSPTTSFPATFRSSSLRAQRLSIDGGPSTRMEDADDICESLKHGKH